MKTMFEKFIENVNNEFGKKPYGGIYLIVEESFSETLEGTIPFCVVDTALESVFKKWDKFSGHIAYPVPSTNVKLSHKKRWRKSYYGGSMWKGEYGKLRTELLEFVKQELPNELIEQIEVYNNDN